MPLSPRPPSPSPLRATAAGSKPRAVVAHAQLGARRRARELDVHAVAPAWRATLTAPPGRPGRSTVCTSSAQLVGIAPRVEARPRCRSASPKPLHLGLDRRHQPVVVERRRAQLARQVEQLVHRLVPSRLSSATSGAARRAVLGERLEAQQDRGERLVDLVVEVARERAGAPPPGRAARARPSARRSLLDALRAAGGTSWPGGRSPRRGSCAAQLERGRLGRVDRLDPRRSGAPAGRSAAGASRGSRRSVSTIAAPGSGTPGARCSAEVEPGGHAGGEQRERDEHHVGRNDLADEGVARRRHRGRPIDRNRPSSANGVSAPYRHAAPACRNC